MHYRMFVTLSKESANTSWDARNFVRDYLLEEGFSSQDGRWKCGPADWFVIGGRWSGELTRALLDPDKLQALHQEFEEKHGWWVGGEERITEDQRRREYEDLFAKYFPDFQGEVPGWRDQYEDLGYEDDAMLLDERLYALIAEHEGKEEGEGYCDVDWEPVSQKMVGNKWIVVVDYHN